MHLAAQDKECSLPLNQVQHGVDISSSKDKKANFIQYHEDTMANDNKKEALGSKEKLTTVVPDSTDLELDVSDGNMAANNADEQAFKGLPRLDPHLKRPDTPRGKRQAPAIPDKQAATEDAKIIDISKDDMARASLPHPGSQQNKLGSDSEVQIVNPSADAGRKAAHPKERRKHSPVIKTMQPAQPVDICVKYDSNLTKKTENEDALQDERAAAKKKAKKGTGGKGPPAKLAPKKSLATRQQAKDGRAAAGRCLAKKAAINASKAAKEPPPGWLTDNTTASVRDSSYPFVGWLHECRPIMRFQFIYQDCQKISVVIAPARRTHLLIKRLLHTRIACRFGMPSCSLLGTL